MAEHADDDTAEDVDTGDDDAGDGVASHEFRCAVHGAEKRTLLFEFGAPAPCLLLIDQSSRQIGIDRHLLARNRVERKPRSHFGDAACALGDHHEIDGDEDEKDNNTNDEVATHHQLRETADNVSGCRWTLMAVRKDEPGRCHV